MEVPKHVLHTIYAISFMDLFAVGLTFPVLAPYIRSLGVSHTSVGILSSAYSSLQVLSGPIVGSWSDVRGRKSVFIITLLLSSLCYFLLGLSTSFIPILITRLLLGIFKHTQTLSKAITGDFMKGNDDRNIFGQTIAFGSMGFVVGPIIGGHLMDLENGFTYVCTLTAFLFIINTGLVMLLPDVVRRAAPTTKRNIKEELLESVGDLKKVNWSVHWVSFALKFLFVLSTTIFFVNHSLHVKEKFNMSQKYVGYAISLVSIVGVLSSFYLGAITKRFYKSDSEITQALHCFVVFTLCYIGFYFSPNFYILMLFLFPFGICNAVLRIVTMELMFKKSGDAERGSLTGASDSVMALARFVAPVSAGFVGDLFSGNAVMLYAMLPCLIGTAICYRIKNSTKVKVK